jgi:GNAT superfamily N-acetyltransferase
MGPRLGLTPSTPEPLSTTHDLSQFDSGKSALDDWLRTRALSNQAKGFTVVMVVHQAGRVIGYYGIAPTAVEPAAAPRNIRTGQPPNPIPCLLIGQLATDRRYTGQGIGSALLAHALRRCALSAELTGGRAVIVDAIDEEAAQFWRRRGFLPSPSDPYRLFRSMADVKVSIAAAERP